MTRRGLAALLALPLLLFGALLPSEAGAVPGKPGKPELIPFITGGGTFNTYFLVKWAHPAGGAANYYEIRDSGETLSQSGYSGSTPEGRYLKTSTIRGGFTWTLKVRGHDHGNPASSFGPWSDTTSAKAQSPTVAASNVTESGARLTVTNLPATWWYKGDQSGAQCTKVANGTSTADITGLSPETEYTYSIYYRSTCTEDSDKAAHWDVKTAFTTTSDTTRPTVTITGVPDATNAAFTATFTFSEEVTGFVSGDITVTNAAVSGFSGSGTTYTATITPTDDYTVSVAAGVAQDSANNTNTASSTESGNWDTARPTVTITGVPAATNAAFTATFTFSEEVTGFASGDITVTNATVSGFSGSGTTYTATITPTGDYTVSVAAGVAQDSASNTNTASSTESGTWDTTRPTVTITGVPAATNAAFTATFTFSKSVTGFASGDITVTNAAASGFSGSGTTYTATITPTGDYTVSVAAGVAQDSANNTNAASSTESGTWDTTRPTVAITGVPAATNAAFTATFTFSESVTGFASGDITVTNATASGLSGSGATYTATITPTTDGNYTVSVAAGVAQDSAGNTNTASSTESGAYDATKPTVTITGVPAATNAAFTATFTFSESVTGFASGDITVTNAAASNFSGSGTTYTATITPTGNYTVSVAAGVAQDSVGNTSTASNAASGTWDTTRPTVAITGVPAATNAVFTATFTFSESVTGFASGDITVTNATASGFSGSGATYTATITPTAAGNYAVSVAAGVAQDSAGNTNTASSTESGTYDATGPTVTITGVPAATNAAFTATFTFSESVTGFASGDITVTGATASGFSGSGATYTATVTPTGDYTVSVGADVAQDSTNNPNTASNVAGGTWDTTRPTVTIAGVPAATNAAFTATFTFSEAVTGFVSGDITAANATVSNFSGSGTTYTATVTPTGDYTVSVAAGVAQDSASNGNTASSAESGTYDATGPTVTITGVPAATNAAFTATFTFSEAVTGFVSDDITAANAAVSGFSGSGATYTATITPTGDYTVSVAAGVAEDSTNNPNTASNVASGAYDKDRPTVTITGVPAATNAAFTATFTFSKPVTGFASGDITATNAAVSGFSGSGAAYTATITPTGDYTVSVAAGVAEDSAGNGNMASNVARGSATAPTAKPPAPAKAGRLGRLGAALAPEAARAMASSAAAAVSERLRRAGSGEAGAAPARTLAERLAAHGEALENGTASLREALAGASLSLPLAAVERGGGEGVSGAALWASGDWRDLSGGGLPLAWDGAMAALHIGADARLGSGLVGLALSFSAVSFDYADGSGDEPVAGEYTARMTGLAPYWGRSWADGSRLWATAGLSSGEVEIEDAKAGRQTADSGMASLAAGGALRLVPAAERGAPSLELKGEALAARLEVEGNGGQMEAVDAGVSRLRVALASEIEIETGTGAPLVPSAELGLVWDGGDGETGAGLELGWGLSWTAPSQGLTLDARARTLLAHGGDREEWGAGGGLRLDQGASGRGASFGLRLSLGHAEGRAARLWEEGAAAAAGGREGARPPARLDAEGGYGMASPALPGGLLTPYAGAGLEDGGGRRYRMGVRLEGGAAARLSLEGARSDGAGGSSGREATLRVEMRW